MNSKEAMKGLQEAIDEFDKEYRKQVASEILSDVFNHEGFGDLGDGLHAGWSFTEDSVQYWFNKYGAKRLDE